MFHDISSARESNYVTVARRELAALREWERSYKWQGRSRQNDRAGYLAVLHRADRANDLKVHYSLRELGIDLRVSDTTAGRILERDQERGLLRLHPWRRDLEHADKARDIEVLTLREVSASSPQVSANGAWSWGSELSLSPAKGYAPLTDTADTPLADTTDNEELDTLLNAYGRAVLAAVTDEPMSARQIARLAGVGKDSALKYLRILARLGYAVEKAGDGWIRGAADPAGYDAVTDSLCGPILAPRRAKYARESLENRDWWDIKRGKINPQTGERFDQTEPPDAGSVLPMMEKATPGIISSLAQSCRGCGRSGITVVTDDNGLCFDCAFPEDGHVTITPLAA